MSRDLAKRPPRRRVEEGIPATTEVFCQRWEETEAGWGVRPDGYSLHFTEADCRAFVDEYLKWQHRYFVDNGMLEGGVPDEYTRTSGQPYRTKVGEEVLAEMVKAKSEDKLGVWKHDQTPARIEDD